MSCHDYTGKVMGVLNLADYGKVTDIVLGVVENYEPHVWGWKAKQPSRKKFDEAVRLAKSAVPQKVRDEVAEDLEDFHSTLAGLGINVYRPPRETFHEVWSTSNFMAWGNDFYNVRDLHITLGNWLIAASPACPPRQAEVSRLKQFFSDLVVGMGLSYMAAPHAELESDPVVEFVMDRDELVPLEVSKGRQLGGDYPEVWHRLRETEVLFDAANIAKCGAGILVLVSSTANKRAFEWLRDTLGESASVESTAVYRSSHIDSTIMPLSSDTVLANGARVSPSNLPKMLGRHKVLFFEDVAPIPQQEIDFHAQRKILGQEIQNLGLSSNLDEMSSPWAGMNVLSLDENLVAVESKQISLIRFLEESGFDVLPVRYRHPYTFLGGLHCSTLDLARV